MALIKGRGDRCSVCFYFYSLYPECFSNVCLFGVWRPSDTLRQVVNFQKVEAEEQVRSLKSILTGEPSFHLFNLLLSCYENYKPPLSCTVIMISFATNEPSHCRLNTLNPWAKITPSIEADLLWSFITEMEDKHFSREAHKLQALSRNINERGGCNARSRV